MSNEIRTVAADQAQGERSKSRTNPLMVTWQVVSTISGIVGMTAMSDDLVAWKSFIPQILESYRSIIHPIFGFLLGWIPGVEIAGWVRDYLFIGVLIAGSRLRARKAYNDELESEAERAYIARRLSDRIPGLQSVLEEQSEAEAADHPIDPEKRRARRAGFVVGTLLTILLWPLTFVSMIRSIRVKEGVMEVPAYARWRREKDLYAFRLLLAIVLGVAFLLVINLILL